jgi:hypothetical protein
MPIPTPTIIQGPAIATFKGVANDFIEDWVSPLLLVSLVVIVVLCGR